MSKFSELNEGRLAERIERVDVDLDMPEEQARTEQRLNAILWRPELSDVDLGELAEAARRCGMSAAAVCERRKALAAYVQDVQSGCNAHDLSRQVAMASGMGAAFLVMNAALLEKQREAHATLERVMKEHADATAALYRAEDLRRSHPDWFVGRGELEAHLESARDLNG